MIAGTIGGGARAVSRMLAPWVLALSLAAVAVGGCQSPKDPGASPAAALPGGGRNVEAKLAAIGGSAANGSAVLRDVSGGVNIALFLGSLGPGEYRVAIHENGNCSSRNGFSAGPPWAPPGVPLAVVLLRKNDDTRTLTADLKGYRVDGPDGIAGRSVVVHDGGSGSLEAQPGVPNNRIACGVIGTPQRLFQELRD